MDTTSSSPCRTFAEKRAHHSPRGYAVLDAVPPLYSASSSEQLGPNKRQVPRSRWALFTSPFTTSSTSSIISEEQDASPSPSRSFSTSATSILKRSASSVASPSLTIRRVLPSPPPKRSPYDINHNGVAFMLLCFAVTLILIVLGAYTCATYHRQHQQQQQQESSKRGSLKYSPSRGREFRLAPFRGDIELQGAENTKSVTETEPELITAVQGQVFRPGSASMVDVGRKRGPGSSSTGRDSPPFKESARTVKNVRSLPDLIGATILLAQGGGRAALAPSKSHAGELLRGGSVRDAEPRKPKKLVRKRTLRERVSQDLLRIPSR